MNKKTFQSKMRKLFLAFVLVSLLGLGNPTARAANVVFSFTTTNGSGMDLFCTSSGQLLTGPLGYFALGYVSSTYDFTAKSLSKVLSDITILGSVSTTNWTGVGTTTPANTGGKVNSFATAQIDTSSFIGAKIVALAGLGATFDKNATDNVAVVRYTGGTGLTSWIVAAPDASLTPVTQTLNTASFDQIIFGNYTASVGNISGGANVYDTIAIPEPSTLGLAFLGAVFLVQGRRKKE